MEDWAGRAREVAASGLTLSDLCGDAACLGGVVPMHASALPAAPGVAGNDE